MEDLSKLLLEERAHSEQFKTNFIQLKAEYDKLVTENHKLQDEISKSKEYRPEEPNEVLKRKVKHLEKEIQGKNQLIAALQEKLQSVNDGFKEKLLQEGLYTSKITSTEAALEQTKLLLSNLQLETSTLVKNLERSKKNDQKEHERDLMTLAQRCAKTDHEKNLIARQVIKATTKAKETTDFLKQENALLSFTVTKLKESIDKVCWEKSELSTQLETIKMQFGQERGEMLMQIRGLECEVTKLQSKCDIAERNIQEAFREKEKATLSYQAAESDAVKLKSNLYALEMKLEKVTEGFKKESEQKDLRHNYEIEELKKTIHSFRVDLDQERMKIQTQSDKLRHHEKELLIAKEDLRQKEIEVSSRLQDIKISTENKYRTILEEKFLAEMEASKKSAETESQLILERNLKLSLELEMQKLTSSNQVLRDRIKCLDELEEEKKILLNKIENLVKDKAQLYDDLEHLKQTSFEQQRIATKERDHLDSLKAVNDEEVSTTLKKLQEQIVLLQTRLGTTEIEAESQVKKLQTALKANQQKSKQYAKLIWKLRQRLATSQNLQLPSITPISRTQ